MALSLYEAVIPSNLQMLGAVDHLVGRAAAFAGERGVSDNAAISWRLAPDMLPFGYQVKACAGHSVGALRGVEAGRFSPDTSMWPTDFAGLKALLMEARSVLEAVDERAFDALANKDVHFAFNDLKLPFSGAQFLLSFAQPNFYFHATTAYAILRKEGVPLGKRDFMGRLRLKG